MRASDVVVLLLGRLDLAEQVIDALGVVLEVQEALALRTAKIHLGCLVEDDARAPRIARVPHIVLFVLEQALPVLDLLEIAFYEYILVTLKIRLEVEDDPTVFLVPRPAVRDEVEIEQLVEILARGVNVLAQLFGELLIGDLLLAKFFQFQGELVANLTADKENEFGQ